MASITSAGVGSGLDVESIISQLMAAERTGLTTIKDNENKVQTKLSIYGMIQSSFSTLKDSISLLNSNTTVNAKTATSSDTSKITATASSSAAKGSYAVTVSQLATSSRLTSSAFTDSNTLVGSGSLTITLGTYDTSGNSFTAERMGVGCR